MVGLKYFSRLYRKRIAGKEWFWKMQLGLTSLSLIDITVSVVMDITGGPYIYPWVAACIRPLLLVLLSRSIRETWDRFFYVMVDSWTMVLFIIAYISFFSWMAYFIFKGSIEGVQSFDTVFNGFFSLLVLMTTANFPDVMLPSYREKRVFALFFIFYLIIGLFMLFNMLLAVFYSNYNKRVEAKLGEFSDLR
jgi:hypothetical protein